MDLSVILPVINERDNLTALIPRLGALLATEGVNFEIIVIDGGSVDGTREAAAGLGARVVPERRRGYAGAIETGLAEARGDYILTLDADQSHDPEFVARMWRDRRQADIIIASRYVRGGASYGPWLRSALSRFLNTVLRRALSMPVRDLSSGFRLYRREAIEGVKLEGRSFDVLEELLVKAYARGFSVIEVPFTYFPRGSGRSHARVIRFGLDLMRSSVKLWQLRNSVESADYDERAFYSAIPIQRFWQRRRHRITTFWARAAGRTLDVGCGSSVIVQSLNDTVGLDVNFDKLRFLRRRGIRLVRGSAMALPFRDETFDCLIHSQVIEHVPYDEALFSEIQRVLRPGGTLIIGTPDYATLGWRLIEPIYGLLVPGGYHDEHITHYTRKSLAEIVERYGFAVEDTAYIARSEMIMRCRKADRGAQKMAAAPAIATSSVA